MEFNEKEWLDRSKFRDLSPITRAVCIDLLCLMQRGKPLGKLVKKDGRRYNRDYLARKIGVSEEQLCESAEQCIEQGIFKRDEGNILYSPHEVRKAEKREPVVFPDQLRELVIWWNGLHERGLVCRSTNPNRPARDLSDAWKTVQNDPDLKKFWAAPETLKELEEQIEICEFLRQPWLSLQKLLKGRNRSGELICSKIVDGGFLEGNEKSRSQLQGAEKWEELGPLLTEYLRRPDFSPAGYQRDKFRKWESEVDPALSKCVRSLGGWRKVAEGRKRMKSQFCDAWAAMLASQSNSEKAG